MLDTNIQNQLKAYLERLQQPIELVATLDDSAKSAEMRALLHDIGTLSNWSAYAMTAMTRAYRHSRSAFPTRQHASVSPASPWATNSPRWC